MEQAFIVLTRNGIPGLCQVERDRMVFEHDCTGSVTQELLQDACKGFGIHAPLS